MQGAFHRSCLRKGNHRTLTEPYLGIGMRSFVISRFRTGVQVLCSLALHGTCNAQGPPMPVAATDQYVAQRDAQLSLERALLNGQADSVGYWVDRRMLIQGKRTVDTLPLFDDRLRTLAHFHVGSFQLVLEDIARDRHYWKGYRPMPYEEALDIPRKPVRSRPVRSETGLYDLWALHAQRVLRDITSQVIDAEEREFLALYWMAMLNDYYLFEARSPFDPMEVEQRADSLLARRPDHPRIALLRIWAREYVPSKTGLGFVVQGGPNRLSGELDKRFTRPWNFALRIDITSKRFMYAFCLRMLEADLAQDMEHGDSLWQKGQRVGSTMIGTQLGYMIVDRPAYRIIPSAGIHLAGVVYRSKDDEESRTQRFVQPTIELNLDLKMNFKAQAEARRAGPLDRERWSPRRHGYWLLRATAGLAPLGFGPVISPQGSIVYFSIGAGGFMQAAAYR